MVTGGGAPCRSVNSLPVYLPSIAAGHLSAPAKCTDLESVRGGNSFICTPAFK
ncbi:hypothetical protein KUCAC02_032532, partial [Chaenocephalus aceratus]